MKRRHGFMVAAVFAVAVTGCEMVESILGFEEGYIVVPSIAAGQLFSGSDQKDGDSVIDLIRAAAADDSLHLILQPVTEQVELKAGTDLGETGLILNSGNSPKELALNGSGRTIDLIGPASGAPIITVGQGVTLTLENITLKGLVSKDNGNDVYSVHISGGTDTTNNNAPVITVVDGGTLVLNAGVVITENEAQNIVGGVRIEKGGALVMNAGALISSNSGGEAGGVYIDGDSTFTMNGGTIQKNRATDGGGVGLKGEFDMVNGTIEENWAEHFGGGVVVYSGGNFIMGKDDGVGYITNNEVIQKGGGVALQASEARFIMHNGIISGNVTFDIDSEEFGGGGVYTYGQFTMENGSIQDNEAALNGGGVLVHSTGNFLMEGGTITQNNFSILSPYGKGGGVFLVYAAGKTGSFQKTGGTIYGALSAQENKWEAPDKQNYYKVPVIGMGYDEGKTFWENLNIHTETPRDIGSAVYYQRNGNDYSYRERTADPDVKLNTNDLKPADWVVKN
jgi:hypothetical protein